jgi:hypothetical protein
MKRTLAGSILAVLAFIAAPPVQAQDLQMAPGATDCTYHRAFR